METLKLLFMRVFGSGASETERQGAHQLSITNDTETCYRFLVAANWKYEKGLKFIQNTISWRRTENIQELLKKPMSDEDIKAIRELVPHNIHKTDRQGRPIVYLNSGKTQSVQLLQKFSHHNLMIAEVQMLEYLIKVVLPKKSAEKGIQVNQIVLIVDLEGVTVKSMKNSGAYKLMKYLTKITQMNYPEIIHGIFFIHVPKSWSVMWFMSKLFFTKSTRSKIHMIKDDEMYKLKTIIGEENLPQYIGGTCTCSPNGCLTGPDFIDFEPLREFDLYVKNKPAEQPKENVAAEGMGTEVKVSD